MKALSLTVLLVVIICPPAAFCGSATATGDARWNAALGNLNEAAHSHGPQFAASINRRYGHPEGTAEGMMEKFNISPGDACIAMKLSVLTRYSLDHVMGAYEFHRGSGWGAVAQSLGISPGSPEFHELKKDTGAFLAEIKKSDKKAARKTVYVRKKDPARHKKNKGAHNAGKPGGASAPGTTKADR